MNKKVEKIFVLVVDFITINLTWLVYYFLRVKSGLFEIFSSPDFLLTAIVIYIYWLLIFTFIGLYRTWFARSRFDELTSLFKASFVGIFILFFLIFYDDMVKGESATTGRYLIFIYWGLFLFIVGSGRLFVRSFQRNLLIRGIGRKNALIVGYNPKAHNIHQTVNKARGLGIDIIAYVAVNKENIGKEYEGVKVVDTVENIRSVINEFEISEIIIALEKNEDNIVMEVLSKCEGEEVSIKIVPDLYEIISGQARTNQIYGFPLIDIMPQLMPEWEKKIKRLMDIVISFLILTLTLPVTLLVAIAIKFDSKGPVFFLQERMGQNGKIFKVIKFRSMIDNAEAYTGPMWSTKDDPRITRVGKFIRKTRIDEIPQMINVLKGEMSLVGPRPERPYFVEKLSKEIPLYKRRLKVRPGVTGWAQVKHKYDETIEDVKTKLRYDLFYIENMSLRMDLKILFRTIFVVITGRGHFE